jgi:hypothetical protein
MPLPGMRNPMCAQRDDGRRGRQAALTIAGMEHGGQQAVTVDTIFANPSITVKGRRWTKQSVVVKSVHDRRPFRRRGVESCWGDYRKSVVYMHDIRLPKADECAQFMEDVVVPYYLAEYNQPIADLGVM